ncbi:uncharacterized protein LOC129592021 [Paramacrobiotus metropolitanus]|uniref:uncharacterized protein LOC129592021 n=1 Tax=Paramacrobiotus metropolitanus TaxID=2943436 RepID=UPI0024462B52|nr:uncharacterized protein LOC129592021 [Paramacrobiotus metropolitanus]XP_055343936.1 uncharacterized protein LOC129592021 [Paramacrobiotus metropolitanus]XP_055343937.1 uncharacterized protein LOC129592021 [Paramacrobiotus metropolitanus]
MHRVLDILGCLLVGTALCNSQLIFPWMYPVEFAYWALGGPGIGAAVPDPGIAGGYFDPLNIPINPSSPDSKSKSKAAAVVPATTDASASTGTTTPLTADFHPQSVNNPMDPITGKTKDQQKKDDTGKDEDKGIREVSGATTTVETVEDVLEEEDDDRSDAGQSENQASNANDRKKVLKFSLMQFAKALDKRKLAKAKTSVVAGNV